MSPFFYCRFIISCPVKPICSGCCRNGTDIMNDLFNGVRPLEVLLILLVAKTLAVFVSANIGFAGGFYCYS